MRHESIVSRAKRFAKPLFNPLRQQVEKAREVTMESVAATARGLGLNHGPLDLVISPNEISFAHGTGVLLGRLLEGRTDFIAARSATTYGGEQVITPVAAHALSGQGLSRSQLVKEVHDWLGDTQIRSILCVPYFESDLQIALAAKAITGAPLGLWIMDDNALGGGGIKLSVLDEALAAADTVFAISPELRNAYETHTRRKIWLLPPMVAPQLVRQGTSAPAAAGSKGVMIGNVWSQQWLTDLGAALKSADTKLTWYASNQEVPWLSNSRDELTAAGITIAVAPSHEELVRIVEAAPFVIVPTAKLEDKADPGAAIGRYSLPTRVPFIVAACGTPLIVVGSPETAAARFVKRFDLGVVTPYSGPAIKAAIGAVSDPARQVELRANAARIGEGFSFKGASELVFGTIRASDQLADRRFEDLFPPEEWVFRFHLPEPPPANIGPDFVEVFQFAKRTKDMGFKPDFIIDVGASTGIWSLSIAEVFPTARYVLCDPMFSRYEHNWAKPTMKRLEVAVSDQAGTASFKVSGNLYNSSLLEITGIDSVLDTVSVPIKTVDQIVKEEGLKGRGLLKVDVQFAEHLVVTGAAKALEDCIDVVILELTLARVHPEAKTLLELSNTMDKLGFRIFETVGEWRSPNTGELEQLDLAFVRHGLAESGFKTVR